MVSVLQVVWSEENSFKTYIIKSMLIYVLSTQNGLVHLRKMSNIRSIHSAALTKNKKINRSSCKQSNKTLQKLPLILTIQCKWPIVSFYNKVQQKKIDATLQFTLHNLRIKHAICYKKCSQTRTLNWTHTLQDCRKSKK